MTEELKIFIEIFGYIGTALVIVSMLMTSVVKLRVLNICGSAISMIYAIIGGAWPIVLLNGSLILINIIQLVRIKPAPKTYNRVRATLGDSTLEYFLSLYREDIERYFPHIDEVPMDSEVHIAYLGSEAVAVLVGRRDDDKMDILVDYATPRYRDLSVSRYLFSRLADDGITTLRTSSDNDEHKRYLHRIGFIMDGDGMVKKLKGENYEA